MALELVDDIVVEILLRLPADDPACLLRASLACKRWRCLLADPSFRRRHRALHRTPSVVGFLRIVNGGYPFASRLVPNGPASHRPAGRELPGWLVFDCRHGRALFVTPAPGAGRILDFIVWNPLTNETHRLPQPSPPPTDHHGMFNAAVLCAATGEGCDHRDCRGGPFLVAFIFTTYNWIDSGYVTSACLYSSVTGDWSQLTSVHHPHVFIDTSPCPSALVGDKLYFRGLHWYTFEYQLGTHRLSVIGKPPPSMCHGYFLFLMSREDCGLEFADVEDEASVRLRLYSLEKAPDGVAQWAEGIAFELEELLPDDAIPAPRTSAVHQGWVAPRADVLGFAEGTDVIFVGTRGYIYMIQLNSGKVRKVFDDGRYVIPFTSFCIPVKDAASNGEGKYEGVSSA